MRKIIYLAMGLFFALQVQAQLLTNAPLFPTDASSLTITVDCSKGNQGLYNYANPGDVYVHIGVITNLSTSNGDWKYSKFNFNVADPAAKATALGSNKYQYTIPNIRSFFGVAAGETVKRVAILFRNGAGTEPNIQRNSDRSDMYITVYDALLAGKFTTPLLEPRFTPTAEPITKNVGDNIDIVYQSSQSAALKLFFNGTQVNTATSVTSIASTPTIAASGSQQIIGEASNGTVTVRDTINFFVAPPIVTLPLPAGVRDGINYEQGDTSAILVLRAPGKNRVSVLGEFNNWIEQASYQMNKTPDGKFFWLRVTGLTPSAEYAYQYLVDGNIKIADPYTQKVLDPSNDQFISATTYPGLKAYPTGKTTGIVSILQTKETAYTWQINTFSRPDKRSLIVYELLLRDFVAAHDWKTLKDTLGYLKTLGINTIELMPFNEFEGNNSWGYNPNFYFAPDKYYGTKNTLKAFVDECHKNGIAVVMDIALNHSFGSSPMVQLYFDASGKPSTNNPWFNPAAKHAFNVGYDMNHESADTKYYFNRIVEFWLKEYKLDGFRFDLSKGFTQKQTCDANGGNCNVDEWGKYDASRISIWKQYYDSLQKYDAGSYVILEHFAATQEEIELSNYGMLLWGNSNYNFNEATKGKLANSNFESAISSVRGWTQPQLVSYMESHDEERLMYGNITDGNSSGSYNTRDISIGLRRNEMAAAFFFMIPGPKMIWQFGELGYDNSINTCTNGNVDNGCRLDQKPIKWDYQQVTGRKRLYSIYSALLKLRTHPLFKAGFVTNRVERSLGGAFKWLKLTTDTSNILVIGNFDVTTANGSVTFQNAGTWYDYLTGETITATGGAQNFSLQYGEYHLYVNRNVTNVITTPAIDVPLPAGRLRAAVYPNPVEAGAQLKIDLPENGKLQVEVYDALGRRKAVYNAGTKLKGSYNYLLSDITGNAVNDKGIQLVKINFNNKTAVVKLVGSQ